MGAVTVTGGARVVPLTRVIVTTGGVEVLVRSTVEVEVTVDVETVELVVAVVQSEVTVSVIVRVAWSGARFWSCGMASRRARRSLTNFSLLSSSSEVTRRSLSDLLLESVDVACAAAAAFVLRAEAVTPAMVGTILQNGSGWFCLVGRTHFAVIVLVVLTMCRVWATRVTVPRT